MPAAAAAEHEGEDEPGQRGDEPGDQDDGGDVVAEPGAAPPAERVVDQVVGVVPATGAPGMGLSCPSVVPVSRGGGPAPAGERDDAATGAGAHLAEMLVFQGELVHYADGGGDRRPGAG